MGVRKKAAFKRGAELHDRPGKPKTKIVAKRAVGS
jgi:hypothetical protein